ncbi:MAG: hypothetical protein IPN77_09465 [Sandaracinaceae bacterium]|nr:hypothetical protein [Sandaracinaceae bacterium]
MGDRCSRARGALPAGAQPAQRDQVAALNIRAMNEYGNFEFDRAQELLEEALALCQRHRITDTPLARTYMNLAIVAIGARQDTGAGLDLFVQALNADANIELDPALSSPDIQSRFILAQQRHSRGGGATAGAAAGGQGLALEARGHRRTAGEHAGARLPRRCCRVAPKSARSCCTSGPAACAATSAWP